MFCSLQLKAFIHNFTHNTCFTRTVLTLCQENILSAGKHSGQENYVTTRRCGTINVCFVELLSTGVDNWFGSGATWRSPRLAEGRTSLGKYKQVSVKLASALTFTVTSCRKFQTWRVFLNTSAGNIWCAGRYWNTPALALTYVSLKNVCVVK